MALGRVNYPFMSFAEERMGDKEAAGAFVEGMTGFLKKKKKQEEYDKFLNALGGLDDGSGLDYTPAPLPRASLGSGEGFLINQPGEGTVLNPRVLELLLKYGYF